MRGLNLLHPYAAHLARLLQEEAASAGLPLLITDTLRTAEEQDGLYAKGRTAPGKVVTNCRGAGHSSAHQWGVAFDFCRDARGREYDNSDGFFNEVGRIAKGVGLSWGGDFKGFKDLPHLEAGYFLPGGSTGALKKMYATPHDFFKEWPAYGDDNDITSTISNLLSDGIITDCGYWTKFFAGLQGANHGYLKTLCDRYHGKLHPPGRGLAAGPVLP